MGRRKLLCSYKPQCLLGLYLYSQKAGKKFKQFFSHFPFQWVFISNIAESQSSASESADKEFDACTDNTMQRAIMTIDARVLKKAEGLSVTHI